MGALPLTSTDGKAASKNGAVRKSAKWKNKARNSGIGTSSSRVDNLTGSDPGVEVSSPSEEGSGKSKIRKFEENDDSIDVSAGVVKQPR